MPMPMPIPIPIPIWGRTQCDADTESYTCTHAHHHYNYISVLKAVTGTLPSRPPFFLRDAGQPYRPAYMTYRLLPCPESARNGHFLFVPLLPCLAIRSITVSQVLR
ncbi:uncharacterized protein LY79DRAFT_547655 [Colletotrichum navitas]|uniref:Uncharacterized protein n=1 Tax=Colletotrichum navitas TaxID=681940 RepID=A0AAD8Q3Q1_9PEZI|nr:uncharacterized protein LY79DRAFT_547655 [Colletotrichum navitas]KAK1594969.1 hypothetical protein LY79DRAFT_547655 [Colletotrichum navitas]